MIDRKGFGRCPLRRDARIFAVVALTFGAACAPQTTPSLDGGVLPRDAAPPTVAPDPKGPNFAPIMSRQDHEGYLGDLDAVVRRGVLRVITRNNSTSYFIYRGVQAGFSYELARIWAEELGVRLEMVVPPTGRDLIPWLLQGKGDVILADVSPNTPRADMVRLTRPYMVTPYVVVTRKGSAPQIDTLDDLARTTVTVSPSSSAIKHMRALSRQTPHSFHVQAALESWETEDLLDQLAAGELSAVVAQKRIVDVEMLFRDDLEIAMHLPEAEHAAGIAVRRQDLGLFRAAEQFRRRHYRGMVFNMLYRKYHQNRRRAERVRSETWRGDVSGALSPWDAAFKDAAAENQIDWRLLVAMAYQESRFRARAESPFGAVGLMQLLPRTAAEMGVTRPFDPLQSIQGGARYLRMLMDRYDTPDITRADAIRFALAAYNVGPGHVDDARLLADQVGKDANVWFGHVETAMHLLSKPRHYRKARFGYCRGEEPVRYVDEIQSRFEAYASATEPLATTSVFSDLEP
jgi:membrane-bound lytic murein transglycosylase F